MNQNNHNAPRILRKLTIAIPALALPAFSSSLLALAAGSAKYGESAKQDSRFQYPRPTFGKCAQRLHRCQRLASRFSCRHGERCTFLRSQRQLTQQQALQLLLAGSGLSFRFAARRLRQRTPTFYASYCWDSLRHPNLQNCK